MIDISFERLRAFVVAFGLSAIVFVAEPAAAQLRLDVYVSGLTLPIGFVQDPTTPSLQYVIEKEGTIRVIQNGVLQATPFLNITSSISSNGERGLLGLAFPPDYASSRNLFVYFTNPAGNPVVARFKRSAGNPLMADPATRFDFRWGGPGGNRFIPHPFANHNGGHLAFGPDGYLYIASGDGGSGNDPLNHGQNPNSLLGKLLRIDVNVSDADQEGYVVPPDNPFVDNNPIAALPEIWAFGLRNPWKLSFDPPALGGTGAMYIGDVGQNNWEEVDYQPPGVGGRNYGWRIREGQHPTPGVPVTTAAYLPLTDPIFEYSHAVGGSITGGFVYRGIAMGSFYRGRYFFADFVLGRLFSIGIMPTGGEVAATTPLEHTEEVGGSSVTGLVSAFGQDAFGEIYVLNYASGVIFKVIDSGAPILEPPAADFNSDRRADLVWFHEGTRQLAAWNMGSGNHGESLLGAGFLSAPALPAGWRVVGTGDMNRDGQTDLYLQSDAGALGVWVFDGAVFRNGISLNPPAVSDSAWRVRAVGDFNHDGSPDLVWQYTPTGQLAFWLLNGVNVIGYAVPNVGAPGANWQIVGTGDANGDGETDLYWQHVLTGTLAVWRMNGTQYGAGVVLSASPSDPNWRVVGTCDLDSDASVDLVFQHAVSGDLGAWYLNGESLRFGASLNPSNPNDINWKIVGPR